MSILPPFVVTTIETYFGDNGREWMKLLPDVIADLSARWSLTIVGDALDGGTHSYVAPVRRADGTDAILKIPVVDGENIAEATALRAYDGDGAVVLYEFDVASGALVLEAARPGAPLIEQGGPRHREGLPGNEDAVRIACDLYRRLWRVPPPDLDGNLPPIPLVRDLVTAWGRDFPRLAANSDGAVETRLLDVADHHLATLSIPDSPEGIVNRDTHLGNIVSARREPWLLIDPKPLLGERAFDAGYLAAIQVEADPTQPHARAVVERTACRLGVDVDRVTAWAYLRALENTLWAYGADSTDEPALHLAVTRALAAV